MVFVIGRKGEITTTARKGSVDSKVKEIHRQNRGSYGARRISEELRAQGESCDRRKAGTKMRLA